MSSSQPGDRRGYPRPGVFRRHRSRGSGAITVLAGGAVLAAAASLLAAAPALAAHRAGPQVNAPASLTASTSASTSASLFRSTGPVGDVRSPIFPSVVPTTDIVARGLVNCGPATGEVGYSPTISSTGSSRVTEWVSIWFVTTKCTPGPAGGKPVPKTVIGSLAFKAVQGTVCPQFGYLGKGYLHLAYNYPGVPNPMIDPSVGLVTVTQHGPYWELQGPIFAGSYATLAGPNFDGWVKPDLIGGHGCGNGGINSEYIIRSQTPFFRNI
jgi:hypothetical protein